MVISPGQEILLYRLVHGYLIFPSRNSHNFIQWTPCRSQCFAILDYDFMDKQACMSSLPTPLTFAQDKICYVLINVRASFIKVLLPADPNQILVFSLCTELLLGPHPSTKFGRRDRRSVSRKEPKRAVARWWRSVSGAQSPLTSFSTCFSSS